MSLPVLPHHIVEHIVTYLPNCVKILSVLCRRWGIDPTGTVWRFISVQTWGRPVVLVKQQLEQDLIGIVPKPIRQSWRHFFIHARSQELLAASQCGVEPDSILHHPSVPSIYRENLVDWIIEVCDELGCEERVLHLAVELVNMTIASNKLLQPRELQLVGAAALHVSLNVSSTRDCLCNPNVLLAVCFYS